MKSKRLLFLGARLVFALFALMTCFYCLLAYIPFTYYHFLQFSHLKWLTAFAKLHPLLYWLALGALATTIRGDLKLAATRKLTAAFSILHGLAGVALMIRPLLTNLQNDFSSLIWSLAPLVSLVWVAAIDYIGHRNSLKWSANASGEDRRLFWTSITTALFVSLLYAAIGGQTELSGPQRLVVSAWALSSNLLVFMGAFVILNLIRALAKISSAPPKIEFLLCSAFGCVVVAAAVKGIILSAVSFSGIWSGVFASALAIGLVGFVSGLGIRLYREDDGEITSGLDLAVMPLTLGRVSSYAGRAVWIAAIALVAYLFASRAALMDWNFLAQKLGVGTVWVVSFAVIYSMTSRSGRDRTVVFLVVAVASLVAYRALDSVRANGQKGVDQEGGDISSTLDNYAGYDISFKLAREVLTRARRDPAFYEFLQTNTNIPRSTSVEPVEVNLVDHLAASTGEKPNIFIFTIDSLRQDYLSPYNKAVNFTPSIDSFARDSVVMETAFTHYGATGLSEPSIWVGGMMLHKQYITPFYPMNSLQKLIKAESYQSFISMDTILNVVVEASPSIVELDKGAADKDFEFCRTLKDLELKLDARDKRRPVFVYTQPQNIHVSVITREGASAPPGVEHPGFYAPYASRIKRMDECFGEFIQTLRSKGLYDNSIIVLTSDHGDSLGEEGRWGHAYTIFPEVIRIPLIIRLPQKLRDHLKWSTSTIAFSTDITPSLYYLLGHKPVAKDAVFGRPLFTETIEEQVQYMQQSYLVVSSYGACYGMVSDNGRALYIADGVNYTDYFYDLESDPRGSRNIVTPSIRATNEKLIREAIQSINQFYNFGGGPAGQ